MCLLLVSEMDVWQKKTFVFTAKNSLEAGIAQLAQNGGEGVKKY